MSASQSGVELYDVKIVLVCEQLSGHDMLNHNRVVRSVCDDGIVRRIVMDGGHKRIDICKYRFGELDAIGTLALVATAMSTPLFNSNPVFVFLVTIDRSIGISVK